MPAAEFAANSVKLETIYITAFFVTLGRELRIYVLVYTKAILVLLRNLEELKADEFASTIEQVYNFYIKQIRFA